jgi:V/A-type H+-transporting ATPase subunit A
MSDAARILRISGSLVEAAPLPGAGLYELVRVGERGLLGEIVQLSGDHATLQVYEETTGLAVGENVRATAGPLTAALGPGLLGSILDGVGRPLTELAALQGDFLGPGVNAVTLDATFRWRFTPSRNVGDRVSGGDVIGTVQEAGWLEHRILVPPGMAGVLTHIAAGEFTVSDVIARLDDATPLRLAHDWPVRMPRPVQRRIAADRPFVTGQRVFDFLFPVAEGGSVAVPGGFGTGKTVVEQSLAKYADADIVVYIGCGERGNEMAEVLSEFPKLVDPRTGGSMMQRTVLVVNTSNMPVAARDASLYLGVTVAEYYRDMGYRVAVMADSTSRWAEALRELGARLQQMPGEEGYPPYLGNRLGRIYERSGRVQAAGTPARTGALTIISAVSPPGGDLSEPVTQASLRSVGALWALDAALAHQRHFPAIDWETSYSLYVDVTTPWFRAHGGSDWSELRTRALQMLERERELREIAALIGVDALQDRERVLLDIARLFREDVLAQSAYDVNDAFSDPAKTWCLAALVLSLHATAGEMLDAGMSVSAERLGPARAAIQRVRAAAPDQQAAARAHAENTIAQLRRDLVPA